MAITEDEKKQLFEQFEATKRQELRERMAAAGRSRSAKKLKAVRQNVKKALAARMKKLKGKK